MAKYLRNLDPNSAYYDPKTRAMRENPLPGAGPDEVAYAGDNVLRCVRELLVFFGVCVCRSNRPWALGIDLTSCLTCTVATHPHSTCLAMP